jgi:ribose transport system substrate-binding protein
MINRVCVILALVTLARVLPAAAEQASPTWLDMPLKKPIKELKIGITQFNAGGDGYCTAYENTFNAYAKELGVSVIVLDAQGDAAKQLEQLRSLLLQRVDTVILWPVNGKTVVPMVKQIDDAGIPVVVTNSAIDPSGTKYIKSFSGPDDYQEASTAASLMGEALGNAGKIVMITGTPGYPVSLLREKGFVDLLKTKFPNIEILDKQPANWNRERAQAVMEDFLTKFGDKIEGVYAENDDMGIGALNAIRAAGKAGKVKIVDATLFKDGYDAIREGVYYGSVFQSPAEDARSALRLAIQVAEGQQVPSVVHIDTPAVTKANIDAIEKPTF